MAVALLGPLREILQAGSSDLAGRAKAGAAKVTLAVLAAGFLLSAGVSALAHEIGYPFAALVFGGLCAFFALVVHLTDRMLAARRAQRIAHATNRAKADLIVATTMIRSTLPLLPILAFVAAFTFGRRR